MFDDLVIARNPEDGTSLPYLVRIPLGRDGIVVKTRDTWPRESKLYCHRAAEWPAEPEVVERHAVRSCVRRGAAIDLVIDRARLNRSQFVITFARGREMIFWQSPTTAKQARPGVHLPTARAHGRVLEIVVDTGERYGYKFSAQQASTTRRRLPAGDYAVERDGRVVAVVERKSLSDLAGTLTSGRMKFLMADLMTVPRAAVVVEEPYSKIFKLEHVSGTQVAESLAEAQAAFPAVPVMFCDSRAMAQEWSYRWLGACLHELEQGAATLAVEETFARAPELPPPAGPAPARARRGRKAVRPA